MFSKGPVSCSDNVSVILHEGLQFPRSNHKIFFVVVKGWWQILRQLASLFLLVVARNQNCRKWQSRRRQQHLTMMSRIRTSQKHLLRMAPPTPQQTLTKTKRPRTEVGCEETRVSRQTRLTEPVSNGFILLKF